MINGRIALGAQAAGPWSQAAKPRSQPVSTTRTVWFGLLGPLTAATMVSTPSIAQQRKPNILVIFGDDSGHRHV
jgi:hypothetical protein